MASEEFAPRYAGLPQSEGILPRSKGILPRSEGILPRSEGILPRSEGILPSDGAKRRFLRPGQSTVTGLDSSPQGPQWPSAFRAHRRTVKAPPPHRPAHRRVGCVHGVLEECAASGTPSRSNSTPTPWGAPGRARQQTQGRQRLRRLDAQAPLAAAVAAGAALTGTGGGGEGPPPLA